MDDSVNLWIELARTGDPAAQQALWDRFFPQLVGLARDRLRDGPRRMGDEEDVVLSVFDSFFRATQEKKSPDLRGEDQLWRLLSRMTRRKVVDWLRHAQRQKRAVAGESVLMSPSDTSPPGLDGQADTLPGPLLELLVADEIRHRLQQLNMEMRRIAVAKLEGYTNEEIAETQNCSLSTVERRLKMIREIWSQSALHSDEPHSRPPDRHSPADDSG